MSKYLKIFLLTMLVVTMLASTAMAGTTNVVNAGGGAANTFSLALEAMGGSRNVTINSPGFGANNNAVQYMTSQNITSGNFVSVYFNGAAFDGSPISICHAGGNATKLAQATPTAGSNSFNFQLNFGAGNEIAATNIIYLTTHNGGCNAAAGGNFNLRVLNTTSTGDQKITIGIVSAGNLQVDSYSSANITRVTREYTPGTAASNHTIDYLGTPGNGTRFVGNTGASNLIARSSGAINIVKNDTYFGAVNANIGGLNAQNLTVGAKVTLADSLNWQGIAGLFLSASNTCIDEAASNAVGTSTLTSQSVTLTIPSAAFNANNGSSNYTLCVIGDGNVLNNPRAITAKVKVDVSGTGANDQSETSPANVDTWDTNAYQAYVTWSVNNTAVPTYCLLGNSDTSKTANVLASVTSSESGVVASGSLGTLEAKTSKMATFTSNSISLPGGTPLDITSVGADKRYVSKITVTATPSNVTMTCIQTDPVNGGKRPVPVLTNSDWRQ